MIRHIAGIDNCIADALSRLQLPKFRSLAPHETSGGACSTD